MNSASIGGMALLLFTAFHAIFADDFSSPYTVYFLIFAGLSLLFLGLIFDEVLALRRQTDHDFTVIATALDEIRRHQDRK